MDMKRKLKDGEAKSVCTCKHLGDGEFGSSHAGYNGHGHCLLCSCPQFTWMKHR
jgi:hypothetical protein